jgi:hypothetical protein
MTNRIALICLLTFLPGCAEFNLVDKVKSLRIKETGEFRHPLRMAAFWTDTVRTEAGQVPKRGFGGRLMFYDDGMVKPVKVKGTLVVYAFDESHRDPRNPRPDRKFVFPAEEFEQHYSKSNLGHSYSFYIEWDDVGGESKEISLICRFTNSDGAVVISDQTRQLLPGVSPEAADQPLDQSGTTQGESVNLVEYQEPAEDFAERHMQTATIDLPSPTGREMPAARMRPRPAWPTTPTNDVTSPPPGQYTAPPGQPSSVPQEPAAAPPPSNLNSAPATASTPYPQLSQTVGPHQAGQGASRTWMARFARNRSPAQAGSISSPNRGQGPWQRTRAARPSAPPMTSTPDPTLGSYPSGVATQP